ncbi:MAG TPA: hypothetical protein PKH02_06575 [Bacteroidales bacterium]|nr:hypothetical protein [Bacteroidales bacterium]HPT12342.1 hypothetical protein [Bacteroidales bacterium]
MIKRLVPVLVLLIVVSCRNEKQSVIKPVADENVPAGCITVARDIVTEIIVRPDSTGDPWEVEKVAGYNGTEMVNDIFNSIYKGKLIAKDYHTNQPLKAQDIKEFEKDFTDRSRIGKLSFTEDWYYDPVTFSMTKKVKSMTFGYELLNNEGKVFGYKAVFSIEPAR